jgi:hypothetical protein
MSGMGRNLPAAALLLSAFLCAAGPSAAQQAAGIPDREPGTA